MGRAWSTFSEVLNVNSPFEAELPGPRLVDLQRMNRRPNIGWVRRYISASCCNPSSIHRAGSAVVRRLRLRSSSSLGTNPRVAFAVVLVAYGEIGPRLGTDSDFNFAPYRSVAPPLVSSVSPNLAEPLNEPPMTIPCLTSCANV